VRDHPNLTWIIDHFGMSAQISSENRRQQAISRTVELARYPNVHVKVSSAPTYSHEAYPFADMATFIRQVVEAYGRKRCFWGTDLTHSFDTCTYRQRITQFTETLDFLSEEDKDWVMGRALMARLGWS